MVTSGDLDRSARRRPGLVVRVATLPERDIVQRDVLAGGRWWTLRATTAARTLADVLRHVSPADSVAIADRALRAGEVHREAVRRVLDRQEPWPYLARGRAALELPLGEMRVTRRWRPRRMPQRRRWRRSPSASAPARSAEVA